MTQQKQNQQIQQDNKSADHTTIPPPPPMPEPPSLQISTEDFKAPLPPLNQTLNENRK